MRRDDKDDPESDLSPSRGPRKERAGDNQSPCLSHPPSPREQLQIPQQDTQKPQPTTPQNSKSDRKASPHSSPTGITAPAPSPEVPHHVVGSPSQEITDEVEDTTETTIPRLISSPSILQQEAAIPLVLSPDSKPKRRFSEDRPRRGDSQPKVKRPDDPDEEEKAQPHTPTQHPQASDVPRRLNSGLSKHRHFWSTASDRQEDHASHLNMSQQELVNIVARATCEVWQDFMKTHFLQALNITFVKTLEDLKQQNLQGLQWYVS